VHLFENLYDLSVKLKINKLKCKELIDEICYDNGYLLFIKSLEECPFNHKQIDADEEQNNKKCINCYVLQCLRHTKSTSCIIQNYYDDWLLNSMSSSIKKLLIIVSNEEKCRLLNLPFFLESLTVVYKTLKTPREFYDAHKHQIKLPYGCKLKIIQDYDISLLDVKKRHLTIYDN
jgi:hypothetical protein